MEGHSEKVIVGGKSWEPGGNFNYCKFTKSWVPGTGLGAVVLKVQKKGAPALPGPPLGSYPWATALGACQAASGPGSTPHGSLCSPDQPRGGGAPSGEARAEQAGRGQVQEPEEGTDRFPAGGEHRPVRRAPRLRPTEPSEGSPPVSPQGPQEALEREAFGEKHQEKVLSAARPS